MAAARFDAEGCAATIAAGAAVAEAAEGAGVLEAARIGPAGVSAALGGLSPQGRHAAELATDALHRALGAAASSGDDLCDPPAAAERVLVAMSGGVDSAVAALLERRRGAEVVAVTLKLWADRHTDGARSCCSPEAVVGARELAHGLGLPHLTLDLEPAFRDTVVEGFLRGHEAGRTPNPCVVCNGEVRIDAMLALARRVGASALATGHYARVVDDGAGPLLATPADEAKDQTYMLSALRPESLAALRFPLCGSDEGAGARAGRRRGPAGRHQAREPGPLLPGRRGKALVPRPARAPSRASRARSSTAGAGWSGGTAVTTTSRSDSAAAWASPPASRSTCSPPTRPRTGSWSGRAPRWPPQRVQVRDAMLLRDGDRVDRVKLRYRSRPIGCAVDGRRRTAPGAVPGAGRARLRRRPRPDRLPDGRRAGRRARHDRRLSHLKGS